MSSVLAVGAAVAGQGILLASDERVADEGVLVSLVRVFRDWLLTETVVW